MLLLPFSVLLVFYVFVSVGFGWMIFDVWNAVVSDGVLPLFNCFPVGCVVFETRFCDFFACLNSEMAKVLQCWIFFFCVEILWILL